MSQYTNNISPENRRSEDLSSAVIPLLKGVLYKEIHPESWRALLTFHGKVRDYVSVMGLELILDETEGYAFLRSQPEEEGAAKDSTIPRLVVRRQLSFPVSLLLALIRRKMVENDSVGGDTRLMLSRDDIVEMIRVFLPETGNETRIIDQVDGSINKIIELGFLRKLRGEELAYEVRRALKSYVDAQWLSELEQRLAEYRDYFAGENGNEPE